MPEILKAWLTNLYQNDPDNAAAVAEWFDSFEDPADAVNAVLQYIQGD